MSANLIGLVCGVILAVVDFGLLTMLGRRMDLAGPSGVLRITAIVQLIAFPIIGWFLGPYIFGANG
ncbi:hypothetical protein [Notoacmeibacter sp. MSK16QG-6]|uniref:hypothetical protein n=1 Tax=Notoacmeibacter sp. MSK16QG-6 TaxID=2957982 RepID=UPI0020A01EF2|nr:hypothetical protein [Notoacmeibacter sp. MSK16QG-6]MCP1197934.1 hypothetical protein [Notoacmeibacter sp. MSK16QG-6]